jgi:hypothetical protein
MDDYSPQIPDLTPATIKNQGVLRRITEHLRSLIFKAGQGIKIDRRGFGTTISVTDEVFAKGGGESAEDNGPYFTYAAGILTLNNMIWVRDKDGHDNSMTLALGDGTHTIYMAWVPDPLAGLDSLRILLVDDVTGIDIYHDIGKVTISSGSMAVDENRLGFLYLPYNVGISGQQFWVDAGGATHTVAYRGGLITSWVRTT